MKIDCITQRIKVYEGDSEYEMKIERNNTLKQQLVHFFEAIDQKKNPDNDGLIGAKTIEMIERSYVSLKLGKKVEINENL